jgi:hypothetical protein
LALIPHDLLASGRAARTMHPSPAILSILKAPPKSSTRSRIPEIPTQRSGVAPTKRGAYLVLISDFQHNAFGFAKQSYGGAAVSGMTIHVIESFLRNPKQSQFGFRFQATPICRELQPDDYPAATAETSDQPFQRRYPDHVFDCGWMKR